MFRSVVARLLGADTLIYECRNCGTELDGDDEPCPDCGCTDVAAYDIES